MYFQENLLNKTKAWNNENLRHRNIDLVSKMWSLKFLHQEIVFDVYKGPNPVWSIVH